MSSSKCIIALIVLIDDLKRGMTLIDKLFEIKNLLSKMDLKVVEFNHMEIYVIR